MKKKEDQVKQQKKSPGFFSSFQKNQSIIRCVKC